MPMGSKAIVETDGKLRPVLVYGSLLSDIVFSKVTKITPKRISNVILKDYKRVKVDNAPYPAIYPSEGAQVVGDLCEVGADIIELLDRFESSLYKRITVNVLVTLEKGIQSVEADVYVWNQDLSKLSIYEWDYEYFKTYLLPGWSEVA
ncbi:hypothetical protein HDV04_005500 [Boothiomyces sp. JEL0838]|nr:hypothetical protein HDV04_005500 [Boothiomyces sp. JEL0838]